MKPYKPQTFGVMLDLSRNAVMSVDTFKEYLTYLQKMGYNCVYFYTRSPRSPTSAICAADIRSRK